MTEGEIDLACGQTPSNATWAYRIGVFFDVVNKTDGLILLTGLTAGAYRNPQQSKLFACKAGSARGHESDAESWQQVWEGMIEVRSSTPVRLELPLRLPPHGEQGLLLVSAGYALFHSATLHGVEDANIEIRAGTRSTEHRGNLGPFDPAGHSDEVSTHAGSVTYKKAESYVVMVEALASQEAEGTFAVKCRNLAGAELAVFNSDAALTAAALRVKLDEQLKDNENLARCWIQLVTMSGKLLDDGDLIMGGAASSGSEEPKHEVERGTD